MTRAVDVHTCSTRAGDEFLLDQQQRPRGRPRCTDPAGQVPHHAGPRACGAHALHYATGLQVSVHADAWQLLRVVLCASWVALRLCARSMPFYNDDSASIAHALPAGGEQPTAVSDLALEPVARHRGPAGAVAVPVAPQDVDLVAVRREPRGLFGKSRAAAEWFQCVTRVCITGGFLTLTVALLWYVSAFNTALDALDPMSKPVVSGSAGTVRCACEHFRGAEKAPAVRTGTRCASFWLRELHVLPCAL